MPEVFNTGDTVRFWSAAYEEWLSGQIVRIWDRPENDPYITIAVMPAKKIFVRCSSAIQKLAGESTERK